MKTTRDKIDEILGIGPDTSVDDVFNNLSSDLDKAKGIMNDIDDSIKDDLIRVDQQLADKNNYDIQIANLSASMKEIEDLITLSKQMFIHIHEGIMSSELIDSELVGAASKFLESMHINIQEFISLYRDKQRFIEKVKLMAYAQEQKKELMKLKFDLEMKKLQERDNAEAVDIESKNGNFRFTVEDVTKMLQGIDNVDNSSDIEIPEVSIPSDNSEESDQKNTLITLNDNTNENEI